MVDCVFCAIGSGGIPADVVRQDEAVMAFRDVSPQAPLHVLVIPKAHYPDVGALAAADAPLTARLIATATELAAELGVAESGYRLVFNTGPDGGQSVDHVHLHMLGLRRLTWPPG